jgi:hypothetical protein
LGIFARNLPGREEKNFLKFPDISKSEGNGGGGSWEIGKQFRGKKGQNGWIYLSRGLDLHSG